MKTCECCLRPDVCDYAGPCLKAKDDLIHKNEEVIEMGLCEVPHIMLRPDQLYRFVVMQDCQKCKDAATPYQTNAGGMARELAAQDSASESNNPAVSG